MSVAGIPAAPLSSRQTTSRPRPTVQQWLWGCCNCRNSGPLSKFMEFCDDCEHKICPDCPWEPAKIDLQETLFDEPKALACLAPAYSNADLTPNNTTEVLHYTNESTPALGWSLPQTSGIYKNGEPPGGAPEGNPKPKRRRTKRATSKPRSEPRKGFACHFCKRNPQRYNPWTDHRYLKCLYPNPHDWRHIRDHFKSHHLLSRFRCQRCYTTFEDQKDLLHHQQIPTGCTLALSPPCDGIDINQWEQIQPSITTKTSRGKSDEQRWFDVWVILFPGIKPPRSPYSEPPRIDVRSILEDVEFTAELNYELGWLKRDDPSHGVLIDIFKQALNTAMESCQYIKKDPQWEQDTQFLYDVVPVERNSSWQGTNCKAEATVKEDQSAWITKDRSISEAHSAWDFDDFVHSELPTGLQSVETEDSNDNPFCAQHFYPSATAKAVAPENLGMRTSPNPNNNVLSHAQGMIATSSQAFERLDCLKMDGTLLELDELLDFTQMAGCMSRDPQTEIMVRPDSFETCLEDRDPSLQAPEETTLHGIDSYLDDHSIEGLLAFESRQPSANGPISHIREMNKGLKGRYEFDGSM